MTPSTETLRSGPTSIVPTGSTAICAEPPSPLPSKTGPLKGDLYSVGVIVDRSKAVDLQAQGTEAFYETTLAKCRRAMEILGDSKRIDGLRVVRDWSYDTRLFDGELIPARARLDQPPHQTADEHQEAQMERRPGSAARLLQGGSAELRARARQILANESGRTMTKYTADARVQAIFEDLLAEPFDYRTLIRRFGDICLGDTASQIIIRLFEAGLLSGFDASDRPVHIQDHLRFDGVGVEYEV
jgi:hypothetical protein